MSWHTELGYLPWVTDSVLVGVRFTVSSEWSLENCSLVSLSLLDNCFSRTKEGGFGSWAAGENPVLGCCHLQSWSVSQDFTGGKELKWSKIRGIWGEKYIPEFCLLLRRFPANVLDGQPDTESGRMCQSSSWHFTCLCHAILTCGYSKCSQQAVKTTVGTSSFSKVNKLFTTSKANFPRVTQVTLCLDEDICSEPGLKNSLCIQQQQQQKFIPLTLHFPLTPHLWKVLLNKGPRLCRILMEYLNQSITKYNSSQSIN